MRNQWVTDEHPTKSVEPERLYDGREFLGSVAKCAAGFEAFDVDDRFLKVYIDRSSAIAALRDAHRWRAVRVGAMR